MSLRTKKLPHRKERAAVLLVSDGFHLDGVGITGLTVDSIARFHLQYVFVLGMSRAPSPTAKF